MYLFIDDSQRKCCCCIHQSLSELKSRKNKSGAKWRNSVIEMEYSCGSNTKIQTAMSNGKILFFFIRVYSGSHSIFHKNTFFHFFHKIIRNTSTFSLVFFHVLLRYIFILFQFTQKLISAQFYLFVSINRRLLLLLLLLTKQIHPKINKQILLNHNDSFTFFKFFHILVSPGTRTCFYHFLEIYTEITKNNNKIRFMKFE